MWLLEQSCQLLIVQLSTYAWQLMIWCCMRVTTEIWWKSSLQKFKTKQNNRNSKLVHVPFHFPQSRIKNMQEQSWPNKRKCASFWASPPNVMEFGTKASEAEEIMLHCTQSRQNHYEVLSIVEQNFFKILINSCQSSHMQQNLLNKDKSRSSKSRTFKRQTRMPRWQSQNIYLFI